MRSIKELYAICEDRNRWLDCTANELAGIASSIESEVNEEYMPLLKGMDGRLIHIGDRVDWRDHFGSWHVNVPVMAITDVGVYVADGSVFHVHQSDVRQHRAQSVLRDKLRDAMLRCMEVGSYTKIDGVGNVPVLAVNEDALDEWLEDHKGQLFAVDKDEWKFQHNEDCLLLSELMTKRGSN